MTENIKMVGDHGSGKTCALIRYFNNAFPDDYVPTVFDNYGATVLFENKHVSLGPWDTAGQEDYDRLRPLSYPETNVFLVVFDVSNRASFEHLETKWVPEIQLHMPETPFLIAGLKIDLRRTKFGCVTTREGASMAMKLGATSYQECSALTGEKIQEVFHEVMKIILRPTLTNAMNYRKYFLSNATLSLKQVKKELSRTRKEVKSLKKHLTKLSDDVIFHIFHYFYLFDFHESCTFYRNEMIFYKKEFQMDLDMSEEVLLQCFGYFSRDKRDRGKRIFQLFYNFRVDNYHELTGHLPKLMRSLTILYPSSKTALFRDYMNLNIFEPNNRLRKAVVSELHHVNFPVDFELWGKIIENDKEIQTLRKLDLIVSEYEIKQVDNSYDFLFLLNQFCFKNLSTLTLRRERPVHEHLRNCQYDTNVFSMTALQKLVLERYVMNPDFTFSNCRSLQEISFIGSVKRFPLELSLSGTQFLDILELRNLRKIRFLFYNLVSVEGKLGLLLSEYEGPLEEVVLHRSCFSYGYLKSCSFRKLRNLKLLVITHHLEGKEGQEEFPHNFLIRLGERTKDIQFLLRSSNKGAFSNMKQGYKLKVIRDIDKFVENQEEKM